MVSSALGTSVRAGQRMRSRLSRGQQWATEWGQRHPILMMVTIIVSVLAVLMVWLQPSSPSARAEFAKTAAQALGGMALLVGLYFTYRTVQASRATLSLAVDKQDLDRMGQVAERFTKSLEQLGSTSEGVRTGALYALERLARDHDDYYHQVIEVICAFIRRRSLDEDSTIVDSQRVPATKKATIDLETAMLILQRRRKRLGDGEQQGLDLRGANACGLKLEGGDFQHADFSGANLQGLVSSDTNFAFASFWNADLFASQHYDSIFVHADLSSATVSKATFLFSDCVANPSFRVAAISTVGIPPFVTRSFERDTVEPSERVVPGGRYLDGSKWMLAKMKETRFGTPTKFGIQGLASDNEPPLDLSGLAMLTRDQWESILKPEDTIAPHLIDIPGMGHDINENEDQENRKR